MTKRKEKRKKEKCKEGPLRVECMGGCGKYQLVRPSKIRKSWKFYGCGKCEGYRKAEQAVVPLDVVKEVGFQVVGGFQGFRYRIATEEDIAARKRAMAIRDAGIALLKKQGLL